MKRIIFASLTICLFAALAVAQGTTGRLLGNVSGPDGLLPGATITATDDTSGQTRTTTANDSGAFKFERLPFGNYTVRITSSGFKTFVATSVKIDANQDYTLNPVLEIGDVSIEVTVEAGADIVNASNGELSNTVSPKQVLDLPVNGRNPLSLLNLQAGVNATSSSINGQRSSSANYTRDGINVQDNFIRTGGFVQDRPSVDDTGEFTVITQNAGAELGGGGSTQVLLVTPRGGNEYHGAGYIYNRNSYFAANEFGNNAAGRFTATDRAVLDGVAQVGDERSPRPFLNRNQYGGKIGGPLPFPGFGQGTPYFTNDNSFFFVNYERFDLRQTSSASRTVLLPQFRDGTYTYIATGVDITPNDGINNPVSVDGIPIGTPVTINVLSGAGLNRTTNGGIFNNAGGVLGVNPLIQSRILDRLPAAGNTSTFSNGGLSQGFLFNQQNNDTRDALTARVDFDVNDKNSLYFTYGYNKNTDDRTDIDSTFDFVPNAVQGGPVQGFLGAYTTILGSNFTNEVRGAYNKSDPFFSAINNAPNDFLIGGVPFTTNPDLAFQPQGRKTDQYTIQDNASYTAGNHTMRFGLDFNAQRIASQTNFDRLPTYNITSTANPLTPGLSVGTRSQGNGGLLPGGISVNELARANSLRYFLGGIVGNAVQAANFVNPSLGAVVGAPRLQRFEYETYGLYFADQWRVTPNLTLNLGLRYDYFAPLRNPDLVYLEPDLKGASTIEEKRAALLDPNGRYVQIGTNAGEPGQFFKPDRNNFGPNISFAYSPNFKGLLGSVLGKEKQTVIRGGFRIGYINDEYVRSADNAASGNAGLNFTLNTGNTRGVLGSNLPAIPNPPTVTVPLSFAQGNANAGNFFNTVFAVDPDIQQQRNMEYSFGIQRELGYDTAIEIRYVGGRSDSLVRSFDYNQVIISDEFLSDFQNAQFNLRNFGAAGCAAGSTTGCRQLGTFLTTVFKPQSPTSTFDILTSTFLRDFLNTNSIGDLALSGILNSGFFAGTRNAFRPNPNAGVVDLLTNSGRYRYNALQAEVRKRFTDGLQFQANYTFQKILTDIQGDGQTRFDPLLDLAQPELEYARADYDRTHTININANYELPFGRGKRFFNGGGFSDKLFGGFQLTSIINISSGTPISILDTNGTLNRGGRSGRQTAFSNLTTQQIKDLVGIFEVNGTRYFIDPSVIFNNPSNPNSGNNGQATGGSFSADPNNPAFAGQVFFRNQAGQTGNLPRNFLNGPWYYNWDAGIIKNTRFGENFNVQLRAEAFNVLNNTNFFVGQNSGIFNIGSSTFGQIPDASTYSPRIMQFALRLEF